MRLRPVATPSVARRKAGVGRAICIRHAARGVSHAKPFWMRKIRMTYFDIFEMKNHRIFKPRQHSSSALAVTHPEAARVGNG
jgi:hypothetical protein